jgi:N-acetylglucosamine malate deacetylase 1
MSGAVDLLAIGAHPDDVEIGCGGSLIASSRAGLKIAVADLTRGELATRGAPERRAEEGRRAAELLGASERLGLGLPDGRLGGEPGQRDAVVALIRRLRPRAVLAPYPEDRHPDHAAAGALVRAACFFAGVQRAGEGDAHRPAHLYHYMLHHPFTPSFVIDVSEAWGRKIEAITAYESQFGLEHDAARTDNGTQRFLELLADRASFHGSMVGVARGEAFFSAAPIGLDSVPGVGGTGVYRAVL